MTRLEEHRKALEDAGRLGPLLQVDVLSSEEVALVNRTFLERCRRDRVEGIDQIYGAYVRSLNEWGVMCPHPQAHRLYDGWFRTDVPVTFVESVWFDCGLCHSAVINK